MTGLVKIKLVFLWVERVQGFYNSLSDWGAKPGLLRRFMAFE